MIRLIALALLFSSSAGAYIRIKVNDPGIYQRRLDFTNIQFLLNQGANPGLTNADGNVFITADSDVNQAVSAAAQAWSSLPGSAVRFAGVQPTALVNDPNDGFPVIMFQDSPAIRSVLGPSALAVTATTSLKADGVVLDSDILFNPIYTFSTTGTAGTYDIQALMTHEFGHALGANHSSILGSVMFQSSAVDSNLQRTLSPDELAFAASVYPGPDPSMLGTLTGTLTLNGTPVHGGLITAFDAFSGVAISGLSSTVNGTFSMPVPPGNFLLYAEPLTGTVQPGNLFLTGDDVVDTGFQPALAGDPASPSLFTVTAGTSTPADFSVPPGSSSLSLQYVAIGMAGKAGDEKLVYSSKGPQTIPSGQSVDLILGGPGIDGDLTASNFLFLGPVGLRPQSVRPDIVAVNGVRLLRVTIDTAAVASPTTATVVIQKNGSFASYTGGLVLLPPPPAAQEAALLRLSRTQ